MNIVGRITPKHITALKPHEIFVFGSNLAGRHGKGAALTARTWFGAIPGQSTGLMGQSFGIPTKDASLRTLPLTAIVTGISYFLGWAASGKGVHHFFVTEIGCGLAGYQPKDIAPLFFMTNYVRTPEQIPINVSLPLSFWQEMGVQP